jgi:hypothetical protein
LEGKEKCTLPAAFSDDEAKQLVKGLTHKQVLKAVKFAKELQAANPSQAHSDIISEARTKAKE